MKKPYIKKTGTISGFNVWKVDGNYIRKNMDEEFTNFAQNCDFKFIPKKEFWIDKEHNENETRFYVDHMLAQNRLMKKGKTYDEAFAIADRLQRSERLKAKNIKILRKKTKKQKINKIHKKLLKNYKGKIKIWIVRGDLVRSIFFIDFTEGGHDKVYGFVPKNEIWLDDDLSAKERKFVLLHEIHERNLMTKGWPYWSYLHPKHSAHKSASELEYFCRKNSGLLDKKLKEEFEKVESQK